MIEDLQREKEMEDKRITKLARLLLIIWNIAIFTMVWLFYYNKYAFNKYYAYGGIMSVLIYGIIYISLCNLYKAYRFASSEIGETIFSQVLSLGLADLILYFECCLIYNCYINIVPGLVAVILQIVGTAILVIFTKQYMINHIPPKTTLLIYGDKINKVEAEQFKKRLLNKYGHLFNIENMEKEKENIEEVISKKQNYDVAILYELSAEIRGRYMAYMIEQKKTVYVSPTVEDMMFKGCVPKHLLDTPLMKYDYVYESKDTYWKKRTLDVVFSAIVLLITSPILLIIALLIKLEDGGPVFFRQKRCTKNKRVFEILKFRSMIVDAEKYGVKPCVVQDDRITKIGRFIRKTRLDEMPQFINILKGDMSIVGPRPERIEHVEQYIKEIPEFAYRMKVLGGLTGYAQIYGKYNTSAYDKLRLDLLYIENQSIILDLKLILLTIKTMFIPESTEGFEVEKSSRMQENIQKIELSIDKK